MDSFKVLDESFYARSTCEVASDLLGKILIVNSTPAKSVGSADARVTMGRIVEVEAYSGEDPASHSARGLTPRCAPMFEAPGRAYVYFIYGMYQMLNFVTEPEGYPGAVLIRAVEPIFGHSLMQKRRKGVDPQNWTNGPGRLAVAMKILKSHNRQPLWGPSLFVVEGEEKRGPIMKSPRVGISQATDQMWRYFLKDHPFVSKVRENRLAHLERR